MIKVNCIFGFLISVFVLASCSSDGNDSNIDPDQFEDDNPVVIQNPTKVELIFPEDNTECNEGEVISAVKSTVNFQWSNSDNTDNYILNIKNLNSGEVYQGNTVLTNLNVDIDRGVPYEWYVISQSKSSESEAQSDKFKFFNQGPGIVNYSPFPASVISPKNFEVIGSTENVILEWESSDVDNDIVSFEILIKVDNELIHEITLSNTFYEFQVNPNTTYNWQILTLDRYGNSSISEEFSFRVE